MKRVLLGVVLSLVAGGAVRAAMIRLELPQIGAMSEEIVVGRVLGIEARWDYEQNYIYSYVTIAVDRSLKGFAAEQTVTVRIPGGEANGMILFVTDTAAFAPGETVAVCLSLDEQGYFAVVGGPQGKFTVEGGTVKENGMTLEGLLSELTGRISAP